MLAHELTHVVQQEAGPVDGTPAPGRIRLSDPSDRFEREAETVADRVMSVGPDVQREANEDEPGQDEPGEDLQRSVLQRQADTEVAGEEG